MGLLDASIGGLTLEAPASGVTLDPRPELAGFQVLGDGQPLEGARGNLLWVPRGGTMRVESRIETDELGRARIAIGQGMELDCTVVFSAPGWLSSGRIDAAEFLKGEEIFSPVELQRGLSPVTLRLAVERLDEGSVDQTHVTLLPWPEGEERPDQRSSRTVARLGGFADWLTPEMGEFRIEGLQPGRYWCRLEPSTTRGSGPPWRRTSFELLLPERDEYHYTQEVGPGAHVRLLGVAGTGLQPYDLRIKTPEGWEVYSRFGDSAGDAFQTTDPIDPGEYVLRIGLPGNAVELEFTAVDGEVTELGLDD